MFTVDIISDRPIDYSSDLPVKLQSVLLEVETEMHHPNHDAACSTVLRESQQIWQQIERPGGQGCCSELLYWPEAEDINR
jgi:hypothetical protein